MSGLDLDAIRRTRGVDLSVWPPRYDPAYRPSPDAPCWLPEVECASPDVRDDFASWFDAVVPEDAPYWTHTVEGPDDMPAHIKASVLGPSLTLPVHDGRFALGTWQGIYLCEHRDHGGPRSLVVTLTGEG